jgi:hypothetical protein
MVAVVAVDSGSGTALVEGPVVVVARLGSMDQELHVLDQGYVVAQSLERTGSDRLGWEVNDPSIYPLLPMPDHQPGRRVCVGTHLFSTLNSSLLFRFTHFQCRVVLVQPFISSVIKEKTHECLASSNARMSRRFSSSFFFPSSRARRIARTAPDISLR